MGNEPGFSEKEQLLWMFWFLDSRWEEAIGTCKEVNNRGRNRKIWISNTNLTTNRIYLGRCKVFLSESELKTEKFVVQILKKVLKSFQNALSTVF